MEKKIKDLPAAKDVVKKEFQKFFDLKVLDEVSDQNPELGNYKHYLPWSVVVKLDSTSSPYRIVQDAGASTSAAPLSLNDAIYDTPKIIRNLVAVELNARWRQKLILSDIRKLYLQIRLGPQSQNFLRVLYRDPYRPNDKIRILRFNSMIWGVKCAGFQACLAIDILFQERIKNLSKEFPKKSVAEINRIEKLLRYANECFYVDDFILSGDSVEEIMETFDLVKTTLEGGSLQLCKISSNDPKILEKFPDELKEEVIDYVVKEKTPPHLEYPIKISNDCSILGYQYKPADDTYNFTKYANLNKEFVMPLTKIQLASLLPRFYDNLNLLGPWKLLLKVAMRSCTMAKLDWKDSIDTLTETQKLDVENFLIDIPLLGRLKFPRWVKGNKDSRILTFVDASLRGISASIYVVSLINGKYVSNLLMNNCKIPALKKTSTLQESIPKLELNSAVLGTEMAKNIYDVLCTKYNWGLKKEQFLCLTDSKCSLYWIQATDTSKLTLYVQKRVQYINEAPFKWYHISGELNLADCGSRSCRLENLFCDDYRYGQDWIRNPTSKYPIRDKVQFSDINVLEGVQKRYIMSFVADLRIPNRLKKCIAYNLALPPTIESPKQLQVYKIENLRRPEVLFSNFEKMQNVYGCVLKAVDLFKEKNHYDKVTIPKEFPILEPKYQKLGKRLIFKNEQESEYSEEISAVKRNLPVKRSSPLFDYSPFLHEGLLRCRGRTTHYPDFQKSPEENFNFKHQVLLPDTHVIQDYVLYKHKVNNHPTKEALISILQKEVILQNFKKIAETAHRRCHQCRIMNAKVIPQQMGSSKNKDTETKEIPIRPFQFTGIDSSGPIKLVAHNKGYFTKVTVTQKHNRVTRSKTAHIESQKKYFGDVDPYEYKGYLLIYICMDTRAVFLDVVSSSDTFNFFRSLERFTRAWNYPSVIYTDQANIFKKTRRIVEEGVASTNEFNEIMKHWKDAAKLKQIEWRMTDPYHSHQAGIWERGFKTIKENLYKMSYNKPMTFEDFYHNAKMCEANFNNIPRYSLPRKGSHDSKLITPNDLLHPTIGKFNDIDYSLVDPKIINDERIAEYIKTFHPLYKEIYKIALEEEMLRLQKRDKWQVKRKPHEAEDVIIKTDLKSKKKVHNLLRPKVKVIHPIVSRDNMIRNYKADYGQNSPYKPPRSNRITDVTQMETMKLYPNKYLKTGDRRYLLRGNNVDFLKNAKNSLQFLLDVFKGLYSNTRPH